MADRPMGCGVIQDLLPLYVDGAAGEESRALVEEHLRSCPVCPPGAGAAAGAGGPSAGDGRREVRAWEKGIRRRLERRVTAAAAGVVLLLIAAMLAASQFVRFGIPGWQLAERDRGEEGQPGGAVRGAERGHGLFPLSGGLQACATPTMKTSLGWTSAITFGPAAPAMRRPGCMWCSTGRRCWWSR